MRAVLAVPFIVLFVALFIVALVATRVVNTAGDPKTVSAMLDESGAYDFVYDGILEATLSDLAHQGLEIGGDEESGESGTAIVFDDPERVTVALKAFVETVLPREYVQRKIDESLSEVVPYARGESDTFVIDLETGDRIEAFPDALRAASAELSLGELILEQFITPMVEDFSGQITDQALGITFTSDEASEMAAILMPADWIEDQLFSVADQVAPYLAGSEDTLEVNVSIKNRVPVAGDLIKQKLNDEDTLVRLVFDQFINPNVGQFVQGTERFSFGIDITEADVQEAVEIVAPEEWVRALGDGIIDALVAWLVGATDELSYTVDLEERKAEAAVELEGLVFRKLDEQVANTPVCQTVPEGVAAAQLALSGVFPSCLPPDSDLVLDQMRPLISDEVQSFISDSLPDEITYSESALRSQMDAESLETLDSARDQVINGFVFTEQDLLKLFSGGGDEGGPSEGSIEALDMIRSGVRFDETDFADRIDPEQRAQFDQWRDYVALGWSLRWVVFLPALLFLAIAAFIGGRGWRGRFTWAGGAMTGAALLFFVLITVGWAASTSYRQLELGANVLDESARAEMPATAALFDSGEPESVLERMATVWVQGLAYSVVPWAAAGAVVLALAVLYPRYQASLPQALRRGGGGGGRRRATADTWAASQDPEDAIGEPIDDPAKPGESEAA